MRAKQTKQRTVESKGIRFRISKRRPLLIVQGWVNGTGPFDFVVDTGASLTILSPRVARDAGVNSSGSNAKAVGAGGHLEVSYAEVDSLKIGSMKVAKLRVAIMDLKGIDQAIKLRLGGIIGYNLLKQYRVTIDYPNKRLFLDAPASGDSSVK